MSQYMNIEEQYLHSFTWFNAQITEESNLGSLEWYHLKFRFSIHGHHGIEILLMS